MNTYNYQNELYHWGIKGMKWGVRRYQNKDGTLTNAGKRRYDRDQSYLNDDAKKKYVLNSNKWVKEDLENHKRLADSSRTFINESNQLRSTIDRRKAKPTMDLSQMTDQELRDKINRRNLENQYINAFAPQEVSKGRQYVDTFLDYAGPVLGITSSALGIALAYQQLTKGG